MRSHLHRQLVSTSLAALTVLGSAASALAQVRDHRHNPPAPAATVELEIAPREAPPPPREERHDARPGFVWVSGRWDWRRREHRWDWIPGHWERERRGQRWREARWEQRGDTWVLVDGGWIQAEFRPTAPPPPPREERVEARTGFVWVRGRWDWRDGNWTWLAGHWERERPAQRWNEGRWELRGDHWEWIEGGWMEAPKYPPLDQPPPPPRPETPNVEPGQVWIPGFWRWENGRYSWEPGHRARAVPGQHWQPGYWSQRDGHWIWSNGGFVPDERPAPPPPPPYGSPPPYNGPAPGSGPTVPPPPPREERMEGRPGFVWVRGRWDWRGKWEWLPGHWERQRARLTWYDGRWEQRGNVWIYVEGGWR